MNNLDFSLLGILGSQHGFVNTSIYVVTLMDYRLLNDHRVRLYLRSDRLHKTLLAKSTATNFSAWVMHSSYFSCPCFRINNTTVQTVIGLTVTN